MVLEAATAAAEEADDGRGRRRLCRFFYSNLILIRFFFSSSPQPTLNAETTVRSPAARHIQGLSSLLLSLMRRHPSQWAVSSLSPLPFTSPLLFQLPSLSLLMTFFLLALLVDCYLCPPLLLSPLLSSSLPTAVTLANYQGLQLDWSK
jgi:hypothetical protein